jgi:hypothetical protein
MDMKEEDITDKLCEFLNDNIYDMLIFVENEHYEQADKINKDIDRKILQIENLLLSKELTLLSKDELTEQFFSLKLAYIKVWTIYLGIPEERMII